MGYRVKDEWVRWISDTIAHMLRWEGRREKGRTMRRK